MEDVESLGPGRGEFRAPSFPWLNMMDGKRAASCLAAKPALVAGDKTAAIFSVPLLSVFSPPYKLLLRRLPCNEFTSECVKRGPLPRTVPLCDSDCRLRYVADIGLVGFPASISLKNASVTEFEGKLICQLKCKTWYHQNTSPQRQP